MHHPCYLTYINRFFLFYTSSFFLKTAWCLLWQASPHWVSYDRLSVVSYFLDFLSLILPALGDFLLDLLAACEILFCCHCRCFHNVLWIERTLVPSLIWQRRFLNGTKGIKKAIACWLREASRSQLYVLSVSYARGDSVGCHKYDGRLS